MAALQTDVLVIGAGPAGSAAARVLAGLGHRVILVDRHTFPRDKICGDAIIPDALGALARLGLKSRVVAEARTLRAMRLYAPNGTHVTLDAELACLPRLRLDDLMRTAAVESGATFLAPCSLAQALVEGGTTVTGAVLTRNAADRAAAADATDLTAVADATGAAGTPGRPAEELSIEAAFTLLATGAAAQPLETFGVCERRSASAMAARIYIQAPEALCAAHEHLCISYDRHICPGYGWIFPAPGGRFNIGVGYFDDARSKPPTRNLRQLLARFIETFPPARTLLAGSRLLTDVRGAPLRTALTGARLSRPGLLVAGEAAGLTYSFSGEGIGKAIESGILAAEIVSEALADGSGDKARVAQRYALAVMSSFGERFRAYRAAQDWLARPAVADFLAGRANSGRYVRRQLEALFAESADPRSLFSVAGMLKSLVR